MGCWVNFQRANQENMRFAYAMINHLQDEMAFAVGLEPIGPRIQIPQNTYVANAPVTMNTTNNIRVEAGSQVGQINAGSINYLNRAVSELNLAGAGVLASALQSFTQAVVDSKELEVESQRQSWTYFAPQWTNLRSLKSREISQF